jgi:hypothetical protein
VSLPAASSPSPLTDLQALADDMLIQLAPRFGVQLPAELQKQQAEQQAKAAAEQATASSSSSSSTQRAPQVVFPGTICK